MRGNLHHCKPFFATNRSIPACAGEPLRVSRRRLVGSVYPRVCGGTPRGPCRPTGPTGLSPRVRGNLSGRSCMRVLPRSIPACAGEPVIAILLVYQSSVYPRVCGGTPRPFPSGLGRLGLSPRVRGNRKPPTIQLKPNGSIPACAGEPSWTLLMKILMPVYPRVCGGTSS